MLQENAAAGPMTDYLTGISQSYPKYWNVYVCVAAITGSATAPSADTAHFQPWSFDVSSQEAGGPSHWPTNSVGLRKLGSQASNPALLELTLTTVLNNFPIMPATISGLIAALGASNDTAAAFADSTCAEAGAGGTFVYDWTFANNYDGTTPTYTPPSPAPSANQAKVIFPIVPGRTNMDFNPQGHWSGGVYVIDSVFSLGSPNLPGLVSWSFSSTSLSFEFAAWDWYGSVEYSAALGHFGALATAPGTITQTVTLGGASYSQATAIGQAESLRDALTFDSIAWGTSWTNTYSPSGALVTTASLDNEETDVSSAGEVGTHLKWAVAVNGLPFTAGGTHYFASKAQVDICGNFCTRTYQAGTNGPVACSNGNIDGYAPFTLATPGTPGQQVAAYNQGRCG